MKPSSALLFLWGWWPRKKAPPMELIKFTTPSRPSGDYLLTVRMPSGEEKQYRGSPTVFRHYPSGARCDTKMEAWLSDRVAAIRWQEEA